MKTQSNATKPYVVLVTGASRGIGLATAQLLASTPEQYKVYGTYNKTQVTTDPTSNIHWLPLDQCDPVAIKRVICEIKTREQRLDVLVNNAGMGVYGPLEALATEDIEKQFCTNLLGPTLLMREVLPLMRKNRYGRIICITSIVGAVGYPFMDVYSGSKFGLEGVCAALAGYVGKMEDGANIQCRVVEPGYTRTTLLHTSRCPESVPDVFKTCWGRAWQSIDEHLGEGQLPEEVAAVVRDAIEAADDAPFRLQTAESKRAILRDLQQGDETGNSLVVKKTLDELYPVDE